MQVWYPWGMNWSIFLLHRSDIGGFIHLKESRAKILSHSMGVNANYGMGLKSVQAWKEMSAHCPLPMLREMSFQRHEVSPHPFAPPSLYLCLHNTELEIGIDYEIR